MVSVYVFNDQGKLVGPVESPKLILTDKEWRDKAHVQAVQDPAVEGNRASLLRHAVG